MYVITGATGHTGRAIVETLLAEGKPVRAVARSAEHLKPLAAKGAEPFAGSLEDADAMARAFSGAEAVYTLVPPNFTAPDFRAYQNRVGETVATAILGRAIGKPSLPYIQFPYEDAEKAMTGMGLSPDVARSYIEMYRAFNDGIIKPTEPRSAKNTTPTSFETFAEEFAAIYKQ